MQGQVPEAVKKARSEALRSIASEKNLRFRRSQIGQELGVVVESKIDAKTGMLMGLTDNYLRVHISNAKNETIGKKVLVKISDLKYQEIFGSII
jgi:threonylcarbamoyladenosine tRNA methylthiotransferase MtaB